VASANCGWIYTDWAEVQTQGSSAFVQMLYVMSLDAAAEIHRVREGDGPRSRALAKRAGALRRTCRELFWDQRRGAFVDTVENGKRGAHVSRQCNALAVLSGVCDKPRRARVVRNVFLNPSVGAVGTPYMKMFEARALAACGRRDAMLAVVRDYWASMLDAGASTFWEGHDPAMTDDARYAFYGRPYAKSLCHAWSSGPLYLLSSELFGLRPLAPGWSEFAIGTVSGAVEWACAEVPTPHGSIVVSVSGGRTTVRVPKGTTLVYGSARHQGPAQVSL
jgi:hypothetical protein